jgi:acetylornithine/N-succinyldiaminopimelate aminotransferase
MTLAKAMANGVPIGAMLTRSEIASVLTAGTHGSTFGGTPFVTSVALATLTAVLEEKIPDRAARMGRYLVDGLGQMARRHPAVKHVRGRGLLIGIELSQPVGPLVDGCRDAGLLVLSAGERVLRLTPPLVVGEAECDRALEILDRVLPP